VVKDMLFIILGLSGNLNDLWSFDPQLCSCANGYFSNNNYSIGINSSTTYNNLIVNSSTLFINSPIDILGSINVQNSSIYLSSSNIVIQGNISLINSSFSISNSSIVVRDCISLNNTEFTVDVSNYSNGTISTITLLKSLSSCIEGKATIKLSHTSNCYNVSDMNDLDSIYIILKTCDISNALIQQLSILLIASTILLTL